MITNTNLENYEYLKNLNSDYNYDLVLIKNLSEKIIIKKNNQLNLLPKISLEQKSKLLELLNITINFFNFNNIEYWLDGGTLLGACRNNKFIDWDDDVDLAIPLKSYIKLKNLFKTDTLIISPIVKIIEHSNPNVYDKTKPYMFRSYYIDSQDFFIDIIIYQKFNNYYSGNNTNWIDKYYYFEEEIYPLKLITFENQNYYIINNPEPYLNRAYYFWKHFIVVSHAHRKELESTRNYFTYYII
jgi:hypothetical protein